VVTFPQIGNPLTFTVAADGVLGEQHLRDFQDNEKSIPTILTTSQSFPTA
jgi:hypothetical protein